MAGKQTMIDQAPAQAERPQAGRSPADAANGPGKRTRVDALAPGGGVAGGAPLPAQTRQKMESSLGADLSTVRVHVGPEAEAMGARAYAQGDDLYFAPGAYQPGTAEGDALIGHELTHVVQQRAGNVEVPQGKGAAVNDDAGLEEEADRLGALAASGQPAVPQRAATTAGIQRSVFVAGEPAKFAAAKQMIQQARTDMLTETEVQVLTEMCQDETPRVDAKDGHELAWKLKQEMAARYGLEESEVDTIDQYQGGKYKTLNSMLRKEDPMARYEERAFIQSLLGGSEKLPKTNGAKVTRTLSFATRQEFEAFASKIDTPGKEMTTPQFDSTTRALKEVSLPDNHAYAITLSITTTGHHGAEISSVLRTIKQSESETLFPPGTKYQVTTPPEKPTKDYDSGQPFKTTAELVELEEMDLSKQSIMSEAEYREERKKRLLSGFSKPLGKPSGKPSSGGFSGSKDI